MNIAIILAGGVGSRAGGGIPKQFVEISGQMMMAYSCEPFGKSEYIDNIQIVAADKWREQIEDALSADEEVSSKILGFSKPGENRQMSVYNALKDIDEMGLGDESACVIIHDAARPFVTVECINECILTLDEHEGAMPVLPMSDTVYFSRTGRKVDELLNRNSIFAGQAPEAFRFKEYYEANKDLLPDKILLIRGSTEVAIMAGMDVAMIPGDQRNFKVTSAEDLERAEEIIRARQAE